MWIFPLVLGWPISKQTLSIYKLQFTWVRYENRSSRKQIVINWRIRKRSAKQMMKNLRKIMWNWWQKEIPEGNDEQSRKITWNGLTNFPWNLVFDLQLDSNNFGKNFVKGTFLVKKKETIWRNISLVRILFFIFPCCALW